MFISLMKLNKLFSHFVIIMPFFSNRLSTIYDGHQQTIPTYLQKKNRFLKTLTVNNLFNLY